MVYKINPMNELFMSDYSASIYCRDRMVLLLTVNDVAYYYHQLQVGISNINKTMYAISQNQSKPVTFEHHTFHKQTKYKISFWYLLVVILCMHGKVYYDVNLHKHINIIYAKYR